MAKDKNKSEIDLNSYNDLGGVTLREMNLGLWLSEHRKSTVKFITIFLIIICAFLFIYSSYQYAIYFISGKIDNQEELQVVSPRNVVSQMIVAPIESFKSGENSDLAIRLKNSNDNFSANFEYCIRQGEIDAYCGRSFILPSEDKYLLAFAVPINMASSAPSFVIKDIFWSRINRREIPDWPAYLAERINFDINDIKFLGTSRSGLSENLKLNSLEFTIKNNSPYSYYEVPFDIFIYSGSRLIGIERHIASNIITGESRQVKISLTGDLGNVSRIEVTPRINIKDESVFLKYQGSN